MFKALNPGALVDNVGNHPNAYFKMAFEHQNPGLRKDRPKIALKSEMKMEIEKWSILLYKETDNLKFKDL